MLTVPARILIAVRGFPVIRPRTTAQFSAMSWMDSWSRPSANSKVPAPLYLSSEDVPYCHTCGRVMNSKKATKKQNNQIKYCSDRCRSRKPGPIDKKIEKTIIALLNAEEGSGIEKTAAKSKIVKGDPRMVITCDEIEEVVFGSRFDPEKVYGRRKNRKSRAIGDPNAPWKSIDMEDSDPVSEDEEEIDGEGSVPSIPSVPSVDGGVRIRPSQEQSDVNFSVGGERGKSEKIEESANDLEKRRQGAKRAEEREMVRRAARRGIVFGFDVPRMVSEQKATKSKSKRKPIEEDEDVKDDQTEVRKAEALMNGLVVEPSFAKGNWSIRWRQ